MELFKDLFYSPFRGLVNENKLAQKAKEAHIDLTRKQIHDFYVNQEVTQLMKPNKRPKEFTSVIGYYPHHTYQMDIIIYDRYQLHHYKYIIVIIDVYSRYMLALPMTNRKNTTIMDNIKTMFEKMGLPEEIDCDNEFNTKEFNQYCETNNIDVRYSDPNEINKNAIVERVNGTIASMLQKIRITTKRKDWYKYLEFVVQNYNDTSHSTTKQKPNDIFLKDAPNEQTFDYVEPDFKVGDKVRILTKKKVFDKGDIIKASKEVYVIDKVTRNRITLEGVDKSFKPYEIKKVGNIIYFEDDDVEYDVLPTQAKQKQDKEDDIEYDELPDNIHFM